MESEDGQFDTDLSIYHSPQLNVIVDLIYHWNHRIQHQLKWKMDLKSGFDAVLAFNLK